MVGLMWLCFDWCSSAQTLASFGPSRLKAAVLAVPVLVAFQALSWCVPTPLSWLVPPRLDSAGITAAEIRFRERALSKSSAPQNRESDPTPVRAQISLRQAGL